ncbi:hypothetical protein ACRAWD_19690 [Caulobacter segnis]
MKHLQGQVSRVALDETGAIAHVASEAHGELTSRPLCRLHWLPGRADRQGPGLAVQVGAADPVRRSGPWPAARRTSAPTRRSEYTVATAHEAGLDLGHRPGRSPGRRLRLFQRPHRRRPRRGHPAGLSGPRQRRSGPRDPQDRLDAGYRLEAVDR